MSSSILIKSNDDEIIHMNLIRFIKIKGSCEVDKFSIGLNMNVDNDDTKNVKILLTDLYEEIKKISRKYKTSSEQKMITE